MESWFSVPRIERVLKELARNPTGFRRRVVHMSNKHFFFSFSIWRRIKNRNLLIKEE